MSRVVLQTSDRVAIVGSFVTVAAAKGAVLLLHMMPADRTSWQVLQDALQERGVSSLAIDLRGHGESVNQGGQRLDYHNFNDQDHQASIEDVETALMWLIHHGFSLGSIAVAGASIGANLALVAAAKHQQIPAVVLLSPGENYRGVRTFLPAHELTPTQALWVAASQGDDQESFEAAQKIVQLAECSDKQLMTYTGAGHGTVLFQTYPALVTKLAEWLSNHLPR